MSGAFIQITLLNYYIILYLRNHGIGEVYGAISRGSIDPMGNESESVAIASSMATGCSFDFRDSKN